MLWVGIHFIRKGRMSLGISARSQGRSESGDAPGETGREGLADFLTARGLARRQSWFGEGRCLGHFGELLQGAFSEGVEAGLRGLVTLPCADHQATASIEVAIGGGKIRAPEGRGKARDVIERYLERNALPRHFDIALRLESRIPVGVGMGSSTSDVVATIRALDDTFGLATSAADAAALCLECEAASDSVMFGRQAVLFAQRRGAVIEDFGVVFPSLAIVGVDLEPDGVFDTDLTPPAAYSEPQIMRFDTLRSQLRRAFRTVDLAALGAVATESAEINERFFPKPRFAAFTRLAERLGALGVCISHSGTIAGLVFARSEVERVGQAGAALIENSFNHIGVYHVG